jgi:Lipase maturation factor
MISHGQRMNMSFNPFHLINTYGAFGSIARTRREVVIEGTDEPTITEQTLWTEYEFKGKPGPVRQLPRQWAPYHLRLDWLMWFAAISPQYADSWLQPFMLRLLQNDAATLRLLRGNPFPDPPPQYVRAQLYRYRFTTAAELRRDHAWWHRTLEGDYLRPFSLNEATAD